MLQHGFDALYFRGEGWLATIAAWSAHSSGVSALPFVQCTGWLVIWEQLLRARPSDPPNVRALSRVKVARAAVVPLHLQFAAEADHRALVVGVVTLNALTGLKGSQFAQK